MFSPFFSVKYLLRYLIRQFSSKPLLPLFLFHYSRPASQPSFYLSSTAQLALSQLGRSSVEESQWLQHTISQISINNIALLQKSKCCAGTDRQQESSVTKAFYCTHHYWMSTGTFWSSFTAALHEICGQIGRYSEKSRKRIN